MISFRYLVLDVDAAVRFYKENLGFELKQQFGPAMAIVLKGELTLWLADTLRGSIRQCDRALSAGLNRNALRVTEKVLRIPSTFD